MCSHVLGACVPWESILCMSLPTGSAFERVSKSTSSPLPAVGEEPAVRGFEKTLEVLRHVRRFALGLHKKSERKMFHSQFPDASRRGGGASAPAGGSAADRKCEVHKGVCPGVRNPKVAFSGWRPSSPLPHLASQDPRLAVSAEAAAKVSARAGDTTAQFPVDSATAFCRHCKQRGFRPLKATWEGAEKNAGNPPSRSLHTGRPACYVGTFRGFSGVWNRRSARRRWVRLPVPMSAVFGC